MLKSLVFRAGFNTVKLQLGLGALLDLGLCVRCLSTGADGRVCGLVCHLSSRQCGHQPACMSLNGSP